MPLAAFAVRNRKGCPMTVLDQHVSIFAKATETDVADNVPLHEVLEAIRNGTYQQGVAHVQQAKHVSKQAYRRAKEQLPAFTPCCALTTRAKHVSMTQKLVSVTGCLHFDFDAVADIEALKTRLTRHPATVFVFRSPGAGGLKLNLAATGIVDEASYKRAWRHVLGKLKAAFPDVTISEDVHVSFLSSLCYVSHDPTVYVNPHAVPIVIPTHGPDDEDPPEVAQQTTDDFDPARITSALMVLSSEHYDDWIAIGQALHSTGHPLARALWDWWSSRSPKYDTTVQEPKWHSFTQNGGRDLGEIYTRAHQHGWRPAGWGTSGTNGTQTGNYHVTQEDFPPWKIGPFAGLDTGDEGRPTNTTFTTYPQEKRVPWPVMQPEALYGLAGDYVRAIAPQSEADPAALLGQLLTTFGVAAGRHRYCQVEATRHYPNIYVTVVGQTARSRKGTSYAHIDVQIRAADPTWSLDNLLKGVGSGEGLIFAVRDATWKQTAGKERGRPAHYEDELVDAGVTDKRALFQTGEFSSVLKVAGREGNTLSEVLRDAWDSGNLRNATKNHPLRATGAHVGIAAHITMAEVQRLLTSTEMANGFANRFLWICAKRSQELPDGGDLSQESLQPLRERLSAALRFAHQSGRLTRTPEASAAWHAVYGLLSEDRTGLANTLLARAEAQVLRLSMLYALLECSAVITLDHLNAALALWEYAEDSAAYIFGTATGDPTADAIVAALAKAGDTGITQNELVQTTFHRNVPAHEVRRALITLEQQNRVKVTKSKPGKQGRPAEVYTLAHLQGYVVNVVNSRRYLSASNDAAKRVLISTVENTPDVRGNSPSTPEPPLEPQTPAPAFDGLTAAVMLCHYCGSAQPVALQMHLGGTEGTFYCLTCDRKAGEWQQTAAAAGEHVPVPPVVVGQATGTVLAEPEVPASPAFPTLPVTEMFCDACGRPTPVDLVTAPDGPYGPLHCTACGSVVGEWAGFYEPGQAETTKGASTGTAPPPEGRAHPHDPRAYTSMFCEGCNAESAVRHTVSPDGCMGEVFCRTCGRAICGWKGYRKPAAPTPVTDGGVVEQTSGDVAPEIVVQGVLYCGHYQSLDALFGTAHPPCHRK
jgi:hypothetical protein